MKKFKITKGDRVYIVDAKSHIDAISKVKAVKDSSIKDYSPEVYVKELEKLIPEYQRLGDLKSKIRESLVSSGKMDKSKMGPDFKLILNDAKVQQWLKQVRELDKKWNNLLTNLNRFGVNEYKQQSNGSDLDVWLNSLPDSWTINDIKFAVKSESRKYKDSISQWNPGMSEIGLFQISYKRNGVYQSILVRANSEEQAKQKLLNNLNGVDIIGVNSHPSPHFHEPILDSSIKDINQVLLSNLKQVAQKGDAWRNKWKKLLDMTDKWNSYQWKELRNNDPKKYELIIRNEEYAEKEAEALNREWDRAIDALSRDRSFGKPGDYRMDLHSYKSRNDNYPMGNSQRYDEILYGYEQAEKSAREKKGLDSSIKDDWSGIRSNGVIFNYSNGKYTITHKNGKVETFPGNKFNTVEELFKYIDNIKDSKIKDSGINYGTLFIDLNSSNELTASRIVQELENEIGNNKIAEIRGGSFTPVSEHSDGRLDLDFKEFKNNEWGTNHITLMVRSPLPLLIKTMKDDPKYGAYKLRAELNSKLKQFANKTIYSNKSFTMDSKLKDAPAIIPAQNVPEHIVFRNRVKPEDLVQSLKKSKTDSTFESVAIGNISEIIADFKADFANSKLDRVAVVSHYKEYRRNAEHWRDQVSATVRNKLDEMMRVIPA